jgi:hypothetical protein
MKKTLFLFAFPLFFIPVLMSQSCDVSMAALKGVYTGDCNKGKADGKGVATGTDSYSGSFKNGYPDGEGKYTWKNGDIYTGSWKNGLFEGQGTLTRTKSEDSANVSVLTGFWKKGKYLGRYEKPYVLTTLTNNINDVSVRKINTAEPTITITVKSITGGGSDLSNPQLPKCRLADIQLLTGTFQQQVNDESSSPVTNKYFLRKVTFPFCATFNFETARQQMERVSIEFREDGNWFVQVNIDN